MSGSKNLILYFSATGNTARVVDILSQELRNGGEEASVGLLSAGAGAPADVAGYDRLVLVFPVLAMMPPVFIRRILRRMPRGLRPDGSRARAVVLATAGGQGGTAATWAMSVLRRRGYDPELSARLSYPENWVQVGEVPRSEEDAAMKKARGDEAARSIAAKLLRGERELDRVGAGLWILGRSLGFLFGVFGRRFLGKIFVADERCSGCGLCARTCPAGTILLPKGRRAPKSRAARPFWRSNCENCNRCMNICPERAINASVLNIVLQFASIGTLMILGLEGLNELLWPLIAPYMPAGIGSALHVLLAVATVIGAHLFSIGPMDFFVYRWIRAIPGLRAAFALSYSRNFRRYLAPGFKPAPVSPNAHSE
jgi:ferredoxin